MRRTESRELGALCLMCVTRVAGFALFQIPTMDLKLGSFRLQCLVTADTCSSYPGQGANVMDSEQTCPDTGSRPTL